MTPDPESTDCLLWIFDSSFERLLLSQGAAGATLPGVTVESGNYPHVAPVLDATRRRLGLDITVLRCLADRGPGSDGPGPREYSAFCRCPTMTLAHGLQWAPVREAEAKLSASARTRGAGPVFDSRPEAGRPDPASRVPWQRGEVWSAEAMGWIDSSVSRLGLVSVGPPRQLHVWTISSS